jgi:hypothetical protein
MEDCPATVVYSLVYEYTLNPDETDHFTDLDRIYVYVFEKKTGECVLMDTKTGPFSSDFRYTLSLFPGEYDIITWGYDWPDNDPSQRMTTVIPDIKVGIWGEPGTGTKLSDARLILAGLEKDGKDGVMNTVDSRIENTFYSETQAGIDDVYESHTDTVQLINLTNQVRIIFEDMTTARLQNSVTVKITDKNGAYYFYQGGLSDNPVYDASYDRVAYLPCAVYKTDSVLNKDPIVTRDFRTAGLDSVLVVDLSVLRLFKNSDPFITSYPNAYLVIEWEDDNGTRFGEGGDNPGLMISLTDLLGAGLEKSGKAYTQENLDKLNRWEIKMNLQETYVTGTVNVLGWEVHVVNVAGGLYP